MKTTERTLLIVTMAGFGMKIGHVPLAAIILTLGSVLLALFYFLTGRALLPNANKDRSGFPIVLTGSIALGVSVIVVLLKVQHWPFATALALLGVLLCSATVVAVIISRNAAPREEFRRILQRVIPALVLVGLVAMMPLL